jgi:hypothetical protein
MDLQLPVTPTFGASRAHNAELLLDKENAEINSPLQLAKLCSTVANASTPIKTPGATRAPAKTPVSQGTRRGGAAPKAAQAGTPVNPELVEQLRTQIERLLAEKAHDQALLAQKDAILLQIKERQLAQKLELAATVPILTRAGTTPHSPTLRQWSRQGPLSVSIPSLDICEGGHVQYRVAVMHNGVPESFVIQGRGYSDFRAFRQVLQQAAYLDAAPHSSVVPFCTNTDAIEVQTLNRLCKLAFPPKLLFGNLQPDVLEARRAALQLYLEEVVQICRLAARGSSVRKIISSWLEILPEVEDLAWRSAVVFRVG